MPQNPEEESFIEDEVVSTIKYRWGPSKIRTEKCPFDLEQGSHHGHLGKGHFCGIVRSGLRNYWEVRK